MTVGDSCPFHHISSMLAVALGVPAGLAAVHSRRRRRDPSTSIGLPARRLGVDFLGRNCHKRLALAAAQKATSVTNDTFKGAAKAKNRMNCVALCVACELRDQCAENVCSKCSKWPSRHGGLL